MGPYLRRAARNINEWLEETSKQTLKLYLERFYAELYIFLLSRANVRPALGLFGINLELHWFENVINVINFHSWE